ncbi:MAG TPA: winged helix-turn-helix domain-containing protein [Acidobacteriota bacterium]|nr:winged helix-turn-helix domain-containing protein [Acidobacteriota bacterium]
MSQCRDFRLGDWLVEPRTGRLTGPEGERRLEPKVMEVLVYLAHEEGVPASREEIVKAVWGDVAVDDSGLFRYISQIRAALGDDARRPVYVETLPKRGYRLLMPVRFSDAEPRKVESSRSRPRSPWSRLSWIGAALAGLALVLYSLFQPRLAPPPMPGTESQTPAHGVSADTLRVLRLGDYLEDRVTCDAYRKARSAFRKVTDEHPHALFELIELNMAASVLGCWPGREAYAEIERLARHPSLPQAERGVAMAGLALFRDRDPAAADGYLSRALDSSPRLKQDQLLPALIRGLSGDFSSAVAEAGMIVDGTPPHPGRHWTLGVLLYFSRRYPQAISHFRQMEELFPAFQPAQAMLALSLLKNREYQEALRTADGMSQAPDPGSRFALIPGYVYGMAGEKKKAAEFARRWQDRARGQWVSPLGLALLSHAVGDDHQALDRLQQAYKEGDPWLVLLKVDPTFDSIRDLEPSAALDTADSGS